MSTTTEPVHHRKRGEHGPGRVRALWAPDSLWNRAKDSCHQRKVSLSSQLVRALERIAAGETL
jgi:hypothetical protein